MIPAALLHSARSILNFPRLRVLLVYKSHGKLTDVYRIICVLPVLIDDVQVISILHLRLIVVAGCPTSLDGSESAGLGFDDRTRCTWRCQAAWRVSGLARWALLLRLYGLSILLLWREKSFLSNFVVLGIIKSHVFILG